MEFNKKHAIIGVILIIVFGGGYAYHYWKHRLPSYIFMTNGRIEAQTIDIGTRSIARIIEIPVEEGTLVQPGDVVAKLDLNPLLASLSGAEANVRSLVKKQEEAKASVDKADKMLEFTNVEYLRAAKLVKTGAVSKSHYDAKKTQKDINEAALNEAKQKLNSVIESIDVGRGEVDRLKDLLKDTELKASKSGRVLYKLAESGEVLQTGDKVVTILDLSDVYMTVFIPTDVVGKLELMDEARLILDAFPDRVIPANISFVSPEAQFTPRQVETKNERAKMTFRVKARIPESLLKKRIQLVKTGLPGVVYVRTDKNKPWPDSLKIPPDFAKDLKDSNDEKNMIESTVKGK